MIFTIHIGDWSGDGHGRCETFHVETNASIEEVREAYFRARAKLPEHLCPENFMNAYEDRSLPVEAWRDALEAGFDFFEDFEEFNYEPDLDYDVSPHILFKYVMWFIQQGDPNLSLREIAPTPSLSFFGVDSQNRHINFIGYGLFGGS